MTQATITRTDDAEHPRPSLTIDLSPPVPFRGGEIAQLVLKEPTARQVREAEKMRTVDAPFAGQIAYEMKLVSMVAGISEAAAEALPVMVVNHAIAFMSEFIEAQPQGDDDDFSEPEATTLTIDPPIVFLGTNYADLDIREPLASEVRNARQLMRSAGSLFESRRAQMSLVATVSGLPPPVVDALPISTLNEAGRLIGRFIGAGRKTGSN